MSEPAVRVFLKCPRCGKDSVVRPVWHEGRYISLEACTACNIHRVPKSKAWAEGGLPPSPPATFVIGTPIKARDGKPAHVVEKFYGPRE